jgi:microsomal dipeptidase-like Zn-dependent dipeptidase
VCEREREKERERERNKEKQRERERTREREKKEALMSLSGIEVVFKRIAYLFTFSLPG